MECPGHVSLPTLGDDLAMSLDNLAQQTDLGTVSIHHLDLLRLEAQYEVATLGCGERVCSEPELKLISKNRRQPSNRKHFLFLLWQDQTFWIEQLPSDCRVGTELIINCFEIIFTGNLLSF